MRILLVKTSSLGDVIHNLPVVSDIRRQLPDAVIDWCVEESFAAIPRLHPAVHDIVPVAVRRWRRQVCSPAAWREIGIARRRLGQGAYDRVIDTQGLVKSAVVARQAGVPVSGYAPASAREPAAARFYGHRFVVPRDLHAVERNRRLVAAALGYTIDAPLDYGIAAPELALPWLPAGPFAVFLSATSRDDKLWPESHWQELGRALAGQGIRAVLPGGSASERERAGRLAAAIPGALAAPPLSIAELAALLARAQAAIGVDTGLTHLAAALRTPTVAIYTATDPGLTGVLGTGYYRNLGGRAVIPAARDVLAALPGAV